MSFQVDLTEIFNFSFFGVKIQCCHMHVNCGCERAGADRVVTVALSLLRTATTLPRTHCVHGLVLEHARYRRSPAVLSLAVHDRMLSVAIVTLTLAVMTACADTPAPRCNKAVGLVAPVPTCGRSWPRDTALRGINCANQATPMSVSVDGHERQYVHLFTSPNTCNAMCKGPIVCGWLC